MFINCRMFDDKTGTFHERRMSLNLAAVTFAIEWPLEYHDNCMVPLRIVPLCVRFSSGESALVEASEPLCKALGLAYA